MYYRCYDSITKNASIPKLNYILIDYFLAVDDMLEHLLMHLKRIHVKLAETLIQSSIYLYNTTVITEKQTYNLFVITVRLIYEMCSTFKISHI